MGGAGGAGTPVGSGTDVEVLGGGGEAWSGSGAVRTVGGVWSLSMLFDLKASVWSMIAIWPDGIWNLNVIVAFALFV